MEEPVFCGPCCLLPLVVLLTLVRLVTSTDSGPWIYFQHLQAPHQVSRWQPLPTAFLLPYGATPKMQEDCWSDLVIFLPWIQNLCCLFLLRYLNPQEAERVPFKTLPLNGPIPFCCRVELILLKADTLVACGPRRGSTCLPL